MKSTARPPKPRRPCCRRCRNARSRSGRRPTLPGRFSSSPRRTRSSRKGPIRCPKPSSTASCSISRSTIPRRRRRTRSWPRRPAAKNRKFARCSRAGDPQPAEAGRRWPSAIHRQRRVARWSLTRPKDVSAPQYIRELVDWGAGPRAGQFLIHGGKAMAAMDGRFSVAIDDVRNVAVAVLRHRMSSISRPRPKDCRTETSSQRLIEECRFPRFRSIKIERRLRGICHAAELSRRAVASAERGSTAADKCFRHLVSARREHSDAAVEQYLRPEVIHQISQLNLRAQFIVKGFLQGLGGQPVPRVFGRVQRASQIHGRRRPGGHRLAGLCQDRQVLHQKFEAETNITGYLVLDLSRSMGYTYRQT